MSVSPVNNNNLNNVQSPAENKQVAEQIGALLALQAVIGTLGDAHGQNLSEEKGAPVSQAAAPKPPGHIDWPWNWTWTRGKASNEDERSQLESKLNN